MNKNTKPIIVIGGGIAGMTAAIEVAEVGYDVILIEKEAYLGGRALRTYRYFPKLCPPTCGFEINIRRIRQNPRIIIHTLAEVADINGTVGDFKVKIKKHPRYVAGNYFFEDSVLSQINSERQDDFNLGLCTTKALYMPHDMAYPHKFVLDREAISDSDLKIISENCPDGCIDLDMSEDEFDINAAAIIIATGWQPYNANKLDNLGYGRYSNVITNVMMERFAAGNSPTAGRILRPSDKTEPKNIAFVQCAGSRDENHLPYCSAVCCMATLKQIRFLRDKLGDIRTTVFYIDIRTIGRQEKFYYDLLGDENIKFTKGKVAEITEDPENQNLILDVEDTISRSRLHETFDLVVLATGMVPNVAISKLPVDVVYDKYGFIDGVRTIDGIYAAGCASSPCDVSRSTKEATAAAIKAIQCINGAPR